ncbi:NADH-quinone oxidoreductase subunit L [Jannaschia pagri]|uniref:NADH-quinone oxidoreductase subunit L n=1 Tax=Jannaschia pagri TaxID=2829797 RepID=A0ABQ4NQT8_9RHOB|nr:MULTISPECIES: NADH-quinone oxidoreductase subunit L [unclassified Jannaschia]GIT92926.1 NADH-quinone oxidoreductase subunit L [Jannaschia sp. AI_61]GIT96761.1 NADH-quinone oxidoreductase subunit L [Jannaschia sp. AI_62]
MATIILFAPLIGAIICGFGWKIIGEKAAMVTATSLLFLSALLSWVVFLAHDGVTETIPLMTWIESGTLATDWAIRMDRLTATMLIVVTTVSALVHLYSFGYMDHDPQWKEGETYKPRFFAYLSFFTFAMLMLVTADNLLQLFFGWEGVGVASYLLIGFYWRKPSAGAAAMKAFIVNRVGDFGFLLGIFGIFLLTDSIDFATIFALTPEIAETSIRFLWTDWNAAELLAFLLFIGAMGKSAQLGLHPWLPDAMEGPTPVSALIHAATMVTAGVFLLCRMSPLMEYADAAMGFVVVIGAASAFVAATIGLVQTDIKRVIAYSTMSQLGYMFVAAGLGAYSVAMFHLLTHAFFKAMLFLGAGSVIHAMHHEQDMRNYGGLKDKIPYTFWAMMIGTLAITGVGIPLLYIGFPVGFAGFVSKDAIIEVAYVGSTGAFWILVAAALMTSFYSWRLMFLTFYGAPRGDKHTHDHAHESPAVMTVPLAVLAVGSVLAGMVFYGPFFGSQEKVDAFFGISQSEVAANVLVAPGAAYAAGDDHSYDRPVQEPGTGALYYAEGNTITDDAHAVPVWVKLSPFFAMLLGLGAAWVAYIRKPELPGIWAANLAPLYQFLMNKWYFDEIYDAVFVRTAKWLGKFLWKRGDGDVIDGGINGLAMGIVPFATKWLNKAQSGYIFTYAFAMVIGIVILITWTTIGAGN